MPAISRLTGPDTTNLLSLGRPGLADVAYARTAWAAWLATNPTATPAQAEAAVQAAIASLWPGAPVQVQVHVFDLVALRIGVLIANLGEPIPAQWWVTP